MGFLHMADFGKNASHWEHHVRSVVSLEEEFFAQGDRERELGIPISPMNDRYKDSLAVCQDAFLPKVVFSLLDPLQCCLKDEVAQGVVENLQENQRLWKELLARH